jgi:drug/metabolite transporter (DMT)-like permease
MTPGRPPLSRSTLSRSPLSRSTLASLALLAATAVWGAGFVLVKTGVTAMPPSAFLFWRFFIATVVLLLVAPRKIFASGRVAARRGLLLGVLLAASYLFQMNGLISVTVTTSAFLSAMFVVFTPLLAWPLLGERVRWSGWLAVGVALLGIALLTGVGKGFAIGRGEWLTIISAFLFGLQILGVGRWTTRADMWALAFWQMVGTAGVALIVTLTRHEFVTPATTRLWLDVAFMGVVASAIGFVVQAGAQVIVPATTASIIYTLEPVFAAIAGVIVFADPITLSVISGGALILFASWLSEVSHRRGRDLATPHLEA